MAIQKSGKIWLDGEIINWEEAKVHVLTNALHYGSGVFEGIRCYKTDKGPTIFRLEDHIDRFYYSAGCLSIEIPFSKNDIKKSITTLIKINKINECYIRPIAFCGYGKLGLDVSGSKVNTAIIIWPWGAYLGGIELSAVVSSYRRLSPKSVPIDAKISGYYANSIIATMEAKKRGADEAILLDDNGYVAEGAGENIFIVENGKLYTPPKGAILPGITRDSVMRIAKREGIKVIEKDISVSKLKNAEEVFFTGTAVEICPVVKIDGQKIGKGKVGPISLRIKEKYIRITRGRDKKYKKWLTYV
ncbi:MAG: hypothetical protein A3F98_03525 [Candidatus Yanofskybacteria bacterium RIFCSPLOWO2_12_FULL_41_8]|nr:MAG: hypothetical protein A3F98_03525 [Candidatus Yanofskybacteria bacterium RIFCSPLOWO2_12_FULL_41_8]